MYNITKSREAQSKFIFGQFKNGEKQKKKHRTCSICTSKLCLTGLGGINFALL